MFNLLDVLATDPQVGWLVARVKSIDTARKKLTLIVGDVGNANAPQVVGASYLSHYTPSIGDVVHALTKNDQGVLVIGAAAGASSSSGGAPLGAVIAYAGLAAPDGWHICDGSAHGSATLQALTGSANTPDLRDRFIVGVGTSYVRGNTGGASTVTLTEAQSGLRLHNHGAYSVGEGEEHTHGGTTNDHDRDHSHYVYVGGGGHGHNSAYGNNWQGSTQDQNPAGTDYGPIGFNAPNVGGGFTDGGHAHAAQSGGVNTGHLHTFGTGGRSAVHTHGIGVYNVAGAAATTAHENRPPYYALVYIIKKA
jgi:microcystin-dependent protein